MPPPANTAQSAQRPSPSAPKVRAYLITTDLFVTCNRNLVQKVSEKKKAGHRSAPLGSVAQFGHYVTLQVALGGSKGRLIITRRIELADHYNATVDPPSNIFCLAFVDAATCKPFALRLFASVEIVQAMGAIVPP